MAKSRLKLVSAGNSKTDSYANPRAQTASFGPANT